MRYEQAARQVTRQRMGAKLIAAGAILEMSSLQLQERIEQELANNPALELAEELVCPVCHALLGQGRCPNCGYPSYTAPPAADLPFVEPAREPAEEEEDLFARVELPTTLRDHLRLQAHLALPKQDYPAAAYLIANTNDRGLLDSSLEDLALEARVTLPDLERVQAALQMLDPVGVCSRDSRQALLVQLRQLALEQPVPPLAGRIVEELWQALGSHAYTRIAHDLAAPLAQVEQAVEFIRTNLNPYPGNQFRVAWHSLPGNPQALGRPDVVIHRNLDEYVVEVLESNDYLLRISESYHALRREQARRISESWEHALDCLRRAEWFLHSIRMRRRTLQQVTECIVAEQHPYLDTGSEERLQPLTRAHVAETLGKHESTVSRTISGKFVLLPPPSSRVVPLDHFFAPALGIKSEIESLILRESAERPLTDAQICQILSTRGHRIARRTVAKYRLALRIPSSEQRGRR